MLPYGVHGTWHHCSRAKVWSSPLNIASRVHVAGTTQTALRQLLSSITSKIPADMKREQTQTGAQRKTSRRWTKADHTVKGNGRHTFRSSGLVLHHFGQMLLFVQNQEGGHPEPLAPQHLHTALSCGSVVYHHIVQCCTACGHCYVILGINSAQVPCRGTSVLHSHHGW